MSCFFVDIVCPTANDDHAYFCIAKRVELSADLLKGVADFPGRFIQWYRMTEFFLVKSLTIRVVQDHYSFLSPNLVFVFRFVFRGDGC